MPTGSHRGTQCDWPLRNTNVFPLLGALSRPKGLTDPQDANAFNLPFDLEKHAHWREPLFFDISHLIILSFQ